MEPTHPTGETIHRFILNAARQRQAGNERKVTIKIIVSAKNPRTNTSFPTSIQLQGPNDEYEYSLARNADPHSIWKRQASNIKHGTADEATRSLKLLQQRLRTEPDVINRGHCLTAIEKAIENLDYSHELNPGMKIGTAQTAHVFRVMGPNILRTISVLHQPNGDTGSVQLQTRNGAITIYTKPTEANENHAPNRLEVTERMQTAVQPPSDGEKDRNAKELDAELTRAIRYVKTLQSQEIRPMVQGRVVAAMAKAKKILWERHAQELSDTNPGIKYARRQAK